LTLKEQQYFACDTASQSTKLQDMLEILGPPGYTFAIPSPRGAWWA